MALRETRDSLGQRVDAAHFTDEVTIITKNGDPRAVIVSYESYQLLRRGAAEQDHGAALGQTSIASPLNASDISVDETGSDQQLHRCSPDSPALDLKT